MNSGPTRILTKEETAELYATRQATPEQLVALANKCGLQAIIEDDLVMLSDMPDKMWDPSVVLCQNHLLLAAVITQADCRLFKDRELDEYFIYQYNYESLSDGAPLAHHFDLHETVFDAAMNLWFPENV